MAKKPWQHENPDLFKSMVERARSNAATPHLDRRTKRARTRKSRREKAIREQNEG